MAKSALELEEEARKSGRFPEIAKDARLHILKCDSDPIRAIEAMDKTFEIRKNDRDYKVGDILELHENVQEKIVGRGTFTPDPLVLRVRVKYLLQGGQYGLEPGYVAMSVKPFYISEKNVETFHKTGMVTKSL